MQTKNLLTFFSKVISVYAIFNDKTLNDTLTNDIVMHVLYITVIISRNQPRQTYMSRVVAKTPVSLRIYLSYLMYMSVILSPQLALYFLYPFRLG